MPFSPPAETDVETDSTTGFVPPAPNEVETKVNAFVPPKSNEIETAVPSKPNMLNRALTAISNRLPDLTLKKAQGIVGPGDVGFVPPKLTPPETTGPAMDTAQNYQLNPLPDISRGSAYLGNRLRDIAGAYAFEAIGDPEEQAKQLGISDAALQKAGLLTTPSVPGTTPLEQGQAALPLPLQIESKAVTGTIQSSPKLAATLLSGPAAPLVGAALFGYDDEGNFHPAQAAVAGALPFVGKIVGPLAEGVAGKLGVSNEQALTLINQGSRYAAANTVLAAQALPGWSNMTREQKIDAVSGIMANGFLGLGDFFESKGVPEKADEILGPKQPETPLAAKADAIAPVAPLTAEALKQTAEITPPQPKEPSASDISKTTEVHGSLLSQPIGGVRQVPVKEGVGGVQSQTEGGLPQEVQPTQPHTGTPQEVTPAIQVNGKVFTGTDHVDAYSNAKSNGQPDTSGAQEGFVDANGKFISREDAAALTGLPTATEPGKLHSTDLPTEPVVPKEQPLNPGGALSTLSPELQAKSNAVKDAMRGPLEQLRAQAAQKYRVGNNPTPHTLVETLDQSPTEKANGEQPVRVRNDKTGQESTVLQSDLTPIKTLTAAEKTAKAPKTDLDRQLRDAGLDPTVFKTMAEKKAALKRQEAISQKQTVPMGFAMSHEFHTPTIEDSISGETLAPERQRPPPSNETTSAPFLEHLRNLGEQIRGSIGGMAGKTMPRTTLVDNRLGEKGARWLSSSIAARPMAEVFAADVLGTSGIDPVKLGAMATEDNLRSVKSAFEQKAKDAKTPEEAQVMRDKADKVNSLIGKQGFPFKTEQEYQDFLNDPNTQEVINRHVSLWNNEVEPMYREAMGIDPDIELPSRGLQTGMRINLRAVQEGEKPLSMVSSSPRGNILGTLRRKSPFGVQATGAAESYHTDYYDLMENTFRRQLEVANKREFENALVNAGQAIIDKPGQRVMIDGKPAVPFPLQRRTVTTPEGAFSQNRSIYINQKLANEYRYAADIDAKPPSSVVKVISNVLNKTALAGLTDASTHAVNQLSTLFTLPGGSGRLLQDTILSAFPGRPDFIVSVAKALRKGLQDNRTQIAGLAEIGALRESGPSSGTPGLGTMGRMLSKMDTITRLALDDAYQNLEEQGLVDKSETSRREFVNQIGQYNRRAQTYLKRWFRDTGLGPFVTAGTTFNTLGVRGITLNPGVRATSMPAAMALRANMLAKLVGTFSTVAMANYMLTKDKGGGVMGRPGVRMGDIDTGQTDKNGRPLVIPVFSMIGPGRGARVTGLRGFVEAKRQGLPTGTAFDSAARDALNAAMSPWAGPPIRFATTAITGYPTAINVGRNTPVVPPGESQTKENIKQAALQANPVVGGINKTMQPGGSAMDALSSQLPRFLPIPSKPLEMMDKYPEIVRKAQANAYIDDVIGRARKMNIDARQKFLDEAVEKLQDPQDREKARQQFQYRRVMSN